MFPITIALVVSLFCEVLFLNEVGGNKTFTILIDNDKSLPITYAISVITLTVVIAGLASRFNLTLLKHKK